MTSSPWPKELLDRVGIKNILTFRKLSKKALSDMDWPSMGYTAEESALIIALGTDVEVPEAPPVAEALVAPEPPTYEDSLQLAAKRRVFTAAAWIAGASWNQLAVVFNVSKAAIVASAKKNLPENRQGIRLTNTTPTLSTICAWLNWFNLEWHNLQSEPVEEIAGRFLTIYDE